MRNAIKSVEYIEENKLDEMHEKFKTELVAKV